MKKIKLILSLFTLLYGVAMAGDQKVRDLTAEDNERMNEQRLLVEKYLSQEDLATKYKTAAGKLGILRALLESKVFASNQTHELQSMGIVLGDAFVDEMGFHWVMIEDEYGLDPAIIYKETNVILYPLTMISKRVEKGENIDVFDLFNGVAAKVEELVK